MDLAVDGELFGVRILQAVFPRTLQDEIRGLIELGSRRNAVQARQGAQIFVTCRAAGFAAHQRELRLGKEGLVAPGGTNLHGQRDGNREDKAGASEQGSTSQPGRDSRIRDPTLY